MLNIGFQIPFSLFPRNAFQTFPELCFLDSKSCPADNQDNYQKFTYLQPGPKHIMFTPSHSLLGPIRLFLFHSTQSIPYNLTVQKLKFSSEIQGTLFTVYPHTIKSYIC